MWSNVRTDSTNFENIKITISQNGLIFSMLSILNMLSFFLVAEALTGLIYHHSMGENSSFQFSSVQFIFPVFRQKCEVSQNHSNFGLKTT